MPGNDASDREQEEHESKGGSQCEETGEVEHGCGFGVVASSGGRGSTIGSSICCNNCSSSSSSSSSSSRRNWWVRSLRDEIKVARSRGYIP